MIPRVLTTCPVCERPFRGHERQRLCRDRKCQSKRLRLAYGIPDPDPYRPPIPADPKHRKNELGLLILEQRRDDRRERVRIQGSVRLDAPRLSNGGAAGDDRTWHNFITQTGTLRAEIVEDDKS